MGLVGSLHLNSKRLVFLINVLLKMIINQNEPWGQVLVLLAFKDAIKTKRPNPKQVTQCAD